MSIRYLNIFGFLCLSVYIALVFLSGNCPEFKLHFFLTAFLFEWSALIICFNLIKTNDSESIHLKQTIIMWSLIFQIPAFFCNTILDDDFYRYLWDGYIFWLTGNPYLSIPADYFVKTLPNEMSQILNFVSYPHASTIYGPICQYIFYLAHLFYPHQIIFIKLLLIGANFLIVYILSKIINSRYLLLFAWCPLLIIETVYEIHIEIVSVTFAAIAIYLTYLNQDKSSLTKNCLTIFFSACAVAAKLLAIPIILFLLMKHAIKYWLLFAVLIVLLYLPFINFHTTIPITSSSFLFNWRFNGSLFELLTIFFNDFNSRMICMMSFGVLVLIITKINKMQIHNIPRGDLIYGLLFLLSPVVNPWYLLWLLLFAVIYSSLWIWTALIVVSLSYINGFYLENDQLSVYQIPIRFQIVEYGLVLIAFIIDKFREKKLISV